MREWQVGDMLKDNLYPPNNNNYCFIVGKDSSYNMHDGSTASSEYLNDN